MVIATHQPTSVMRTIRSTRGRPNRFWLLKNISYIHCMPILFVRKILDRGKRRTIIAYIIIIIYYYYSTARLRYAIWVPTAVIIIWRTRKIRLLRIRQVGVDRIFFCRLDLGSTSTFYRQSTTNN